MYQHRNDIASPEVLRKPSSLSVFVIKSFILL